MMLPPVAAANIEAIASEFEPLWRLLALHMPASHWTPEWVTAFTIARKPPCTEIDDPA